MRKSLRIRIGALFLILCLLSSCVATKNSNTGITGFSFSGNKNEINLKPGDTSKGYFIVQGNRDFSIEDLDFVSENTSIASFEYEKTALTTFVYYVITAVSDGETNVFVQTKDGIIQSENIHINVSGNSNITTDLETNSDADTQEQPSDTTSAQNGNKENGKNTSNSSSTSHSKSNISISSIPQYSGNAYVSINNNIPSFADSEKTTKSYEYYSPLDSLGRCGYAMACVGVDIMPTAERGSIGSVKPSGWHTVKYDIVDGKYLYNRCHLIGYQLSGENANVQNLITGTRYLNIQGMLPFENMVADYVKETNNHVLYRVTPIFDGNNLVATGVQMEGYSVEDNGGDICFNVFAFNVQPGITIDYTTGDSYQTSSGTVNGSSTSNNSSNDQTTTQNTNSNASYILNTNTKKFHLPNCSSVKTMNESNKKEYSGSRDSIIAQGYDPCKRCNP